MFSVETALIKSTLLEWFKKKIKSQHLELDLLIKYKYERIQLTGKKVNVSYVKCHQKLRQQTTTRQILKCLNATFLLDLKINF